MTQKIHLIFAFFASGYFVFYFYGNLQNLLLLLEVLSPK